MARRPGRRRSEQREIQVFDALIRALLATFIAHPTSSIRTANSIALPAQIPAARRDAYLTRDLRHPRRGPARAGGDGRRRAGRPRFVTAATSRSCCWLPLQACDRGEVTALRRSDLDLTAGTVPPSSSGQPVRSCWGRPSPEPGGASSASPRRSSRYYASTCRSSSKPNRAHWCSPAPWTARYR